MCVICLCVECAGNKLVRGKISSAAERNSGVEGSNTGVEGQSLVCGSGDGFSSGKI